MFKTIAIGCDHAAVEYKEKLRAYLQEQGYTVLNMGTDSTDACDYPIYANKVCDKVTSKEADCGILICGTGEGIEYRIVADEKPFPDCTAASPSLEDVYLYIFGREKAQNGDPA